ncbi:flagellar basal-body rod protein FlgF [Motilimonas pumila]|uniref:Flagellar basal-body rod protein FlgF n=1 Tax=Motilimonas pumila TaxID=2303987 RepID=A0A418YGZ2_9GAMM|nr:flagellar basal-body rod protein FlgF [Motilimonas pumila]RJG48989.1 flagellar basal-body rod protein FlgF [Motilimonas pumila]
MDNLLYIAMSGAKENLNGIAVRSNNLANANTMGFKADLEQARSMQAFGPGLPTRVFSMTENASQNFDEGSIHTTGNNLDLAIEGDGWLAVQNADGEEVFTRNGKLKIDVNGQLSDMQGNAVLGINGTPIIFPLPIEKLEISRDGMIEIRPEGAPPDAMEELAMIKMVNPEVQDLARGQDGFFRRADGQPEAAAIDVQLVQGALESSNVNAANEMTHMMSLQRQFEMQIKMMKTAEEIDKASDSLLRIV